MPVDVKTQFSATSRRVAALKRDGSDLRAITLACNCQATVEDLWNAVTSRERIPGWLLPVEGELRVGGRFQLEGNASGEITVCEPLSRLELTWEFGPDPSWVSVRFSPGEAGGSRLELVHTSVLSDHWREFGAGAAGVGWDLALLGLANHLAAPDEPQPDAGAFATSPDGLFFIRASSRAWEEAAVAAGTDPAQARAAQQETTAFYTGIPIEPV